MAKKGRETASREKASASPINALWTPQPGPQANAIAADWCPLMFYGGGKFSGKSDFLLGDYLQDLETYKEHWQGIVFRRALTEFTELKLRANELFPKIGGKWQEQKSQWIFPDFGTKDQCATLRFRYLERLQDIRLYEGHSYPWIGVDELGDWEDPKAFFRLITFNRYGRYPIPNKRVRATGNPGGRGHVWIKNYFVDPAPMGSKLLFDEVLEKPYMFILGTYRDNKIGMMNDPNYDKNLNRSGSPQLVRALKEGDFTVVAGAFFTEFTNKHIIKPHPIPSHWTRIISMDWGSCGAGDPFSIGFWAIASDHNDPNVPHYRRGTMIRYNEWYGKQYEDKVSVKFVADGIKKRMGNDHINLFVAGGDIKRKNDESGPSIFEMFNNQGIFWQRADMNRLSGWLLMRERLLGEGDPPDNEPLLYVFDTCTDSCERIPTIQHSIKDANDIEETNDDIPDEWRYAVKARAWATDMPPSELPIEQQFRMPTMDELWKITEENRRGRI